MADLVKFKNEHRLTASVAQRARDMGGGLPFDEQAELTIVLLRLRDFLLQVLLSHRYLILAVWCTVLGLVAVQVFTMTPMYTASIQVQVDPDLPSVLPYREVAETNFLRSDQYLETQLRVIRSRILAQRVIERLNLADDREFRAEVSEGILIDSAGAMIGTGMNLLSQLLSKSKAAEGSQGSSEGAIGSTSEVDEFLAVDRLEPEMVGLIGRFKSWLDVSSVPKSRILVVSFTSPFPKLSARAVSALVEEFQRLSYETRRDTTASASEFLQDQLRALQIKVEKSEEALIRYSRDHNILNYDEREDMVLRKLADLSRQITEVEARLSRERAAFAGIGEASVEEFPESLKNQAILELERRISGLAQQKANLLTRFDMNWPEVKQVTEEIEEVQRHLDDLKANAIQQANVNFETSHREHQNLLSALQGQKMLADQLNENLIQYRILKREVDTNKELYEGLLQRLKEAGISSALDLRGIQIVDRSGIPGRPSAPNLLIWLAFGGCLGLALGFGVASLLVLMDDTLKNPEECELVSNVPSLGLIPTIRPEKGVTPLGAATTELAVPVDPAIIPIGSSINSSWEPYRALRTSILLSHSDSPPKAIMVTSSVCGEGKSTTSVNLGIVMAKTPGRTLLIDLDMRRPTLAGIFGVPNGVGMSAFLSGNAERLPDIRETAVPNLFLITAGKEPPNPPELISSRRLRQALEALRAEFDFIIIDTPPVLACTDPVVLSPLVDGVVVVSRCGRTPRKVLKMATDRLADVGSKILGTVLNDVDLRAPEYHYGYSPYHHQYGYYGDKGEVQRNQTV